MIKSGLLYSISYSLLKVINLCRFSVRNTSYIFATYFQEMVEELLGVSKAVVLAESWAAKWKGMAWHPDGVGDMIGRSSKVFDCGQDWRRFVRFSSWETIFRRDLQHTYSPIIYIFFKWSPSTIERTFQESLLSTIRPKNNKKFIISILLVNKSGLCWENMSILQLRTSEYFIY